MTVTNPEQIAAQLQQQLSASFVEVADFLDSSELDGGPSLRHLASLCPPGRLPPAAFGWFMELVEALESQPRERVQAVLDSLQTLQPHHGDFALLSLDDPSLQRCRQSYQRLMDTDPNASFAITGATTEQLRRFQSELQPCLALMRAATPDYHRQLLALTTQLVAVRPCGDNNTSQFDGGSTLMLWGALFVNVEQSKSRVDWLQTLVHESSHLMLFGRCSEQPPVLNDSSQGYRSPLRRELRPMNGIYHALYVTVQMQRACRQLLAGQWLSEAERDSVSQSAAGHAEVIADCLTTVEQQAQLSAIGREILDELVATAQSGIN